MYIVHYYFRENKAYRCFYNFYNFINTIIFSYYSKILKSIWYLYHWLTLNIFLNIFRSTNFIHRKVMDIKEIFLQKYLVFESNSGDWRPKELTSLITVIDSRFLRVFSWNMFSAVDCSTACTTYSKLITTLNTWRNTV